MRIAAILLIGFFVAAAWMRPAEATPTAGTAAVSSPSIIEVAGRCGPHAYWFHSRRGIHGHWIRGHCVVYRRWRHHH